MSHHVFESITAADLASTTGGQMAPSTGINLGVRAMTLLDKPGKTLDMVRQGLGMPETGRPGDVYTPARMNQDGSVAPGRFDTPRTPGLPEVPMSQ